MCYSEQCCEEEEKYKYKYQSNSSWNDPWPSAMARSISPQEELIGWWREDLDPRRHITAGSLKNFML